MANSRQEVPLDWGDWAGDFDAYHQPWVFSYRPKIQVEVNQMIYFSIAWETSGLNDNVVL